MADPFSSPSPVPPPPPLPSSLDFETDVGKSSRGGDTSEISYNNAPSSFNPFSSAVITKTAAIPATTTTETTPATTTIPTSTTTIATTTTETTHATTTPTTTTTIATTTETTSATTTTTSTESAPSQDGSGDTKKYPNNSTGLASIPSVSLQDQMSTRNRSGYKLKGKIILAANSSNTDTGISTTATASYIPTTATNLQSDSNTEIVQITDSPLGDSFLSRTLDLAHTMPDWNPGPIQQQNEGEGDIGSSGVGSNTGGSSQNFPVIGSGWSKSKLSMASQVNPTEIDVMQSEHHSALLGSRSLFNTSEIRDIANISTFTSERAITVSLWNDTTKILHLVNSKLFSGQWRIPPPALIHPSMALVICVAPNNVFSTVCFEIEYSLLDPTTKNTTTPDQKNNTIQADTGVTHEKLSNTKSFIIRCDMVPSASSGYFEGYWTSNSKIDLKCWKYTSFSQYLQNSGSTTTNTNTTTVVSTSSNNNHPFIIAKMSSVFEKFEVPNDHHMQGIYSFNGTELNLLLSRFYHIINYNSTTNRNKSGSSETRVGEGNLSNSSKIRPKYHTSPQFSSVSKQSGTSLNSNGGGTDVALTVEQFGLEWPALSHPKLSKAIFNGCN